MNTEKLDPEKQKVGPPQQRIAAVADLTSAREGT